MARWFSKYHNRGNIINGRPKTVNSTAYNIDTYLNAVWTRASVLLVL